MLKKKLILKDPLKFLGFDCDEDIAKGGIGAVIARAGVGKTAFLVQIAISALLKEKNVLHISVQDLVDKVTLWYVEMFQNVAKMFEPQQTKNIWDEMVRHRFIMTFEGESFDLDKLEKRITEFKSQNIFIPNLIILDGLSYNSSDYKKLAKFRDFAKSNLISLWFCILTNVPFESNPDKLAKELGDDFTSLIDVLALMIPEKERIQVKRYAFKNQKMFDRPTLFLDPGTMLVQESAAII